MNLLSTLGLGAAILLTSIIGSTYSPTAAASTIKGFRINGTELNGLKLNGPGVVLQGLKLNGLQLNGPGIIIQGIKLQGTKFQGLTIQGHPLSGITGNCTNAGQPMGMTLADGRRVDLR